jgi:hypothetical protein
MVLKEERERRKKAHTLTKKKKVAKKKRGRDCRSSRKKNRRVSLRTKKTAPFFGFVLGPFLLLS